MGVAGVVDLGVPRPAVCYHMAPLLHMLHMLPEEAYKYLSFC
jgi:hypothetical protein